MAVHTIRNGPWPEGSTVTAYTRLGIGPITEQPVPPGSRAVDAATVTTSVVVFDDLEDGREYWAVGQDSSSRWRWLSFRTYVPDGETDGAVALLEIAEHEADPVAAHPAAAISVGPDGNVEAALQGIRDDVGSRAYARTIDFGSMGSSVEVQTAGADALLGVKGTLTAHATITVPDLLENLYVGLDLTQDTTGGWTVSVPQLVGGSITVNPAPRANTYVPLISPDGQRLVALTTGSGSVPLVVSEIATTVVTGT
jgi:hypothetical protein